MNLREKLKKTVKDSKFLSEKERNEWIFMSDSLSEKDLKEACSYFEKANEDFADKKLEAIFKAGLGNEYIEQLKMLAEEYKKQSMQKEESYVKKTEENPENILKELNNI